MPASPPKYVSFLQECLSQCNGAHASSCVAHSLSDRAVDERPSYLIDVNKGCIINVQQELLTHEESPTLDRYVALSYRWPKEQTSKMRSLVLQRSTLESLTSPRYLFNPSIQAEIPASIRFAMALTIMLNERYLWVDRLCLVQDDLAIASQISHMNDIYGGAYLTIIAASSDELLLSKAFGADWPIIENDHYDAIYASEWADRGWTYQEQILSKRSAIFTDSGLFWECQVAIWDDTNCSIKKEDEGTRLRAKLGQRFVSRWWPDFEFYLDLICPYNGRNFTNPQDGLKGISATLRALSPSFPGGFIAGLPKLFLDYALLWQPFTVGKRRQYREADGALGVTEKTGLPSWSWCSWDCYVDPKSLVAGLAYIDKSHCQSRCGTWSVQNLVQWSTCSSYPGNKKDLPSTMDPIVEPKELQTMRTIKASTGWAMHNRNDLRKQERTYFTYPERGDCRFTHPIPLNEPGQSIKPDSIPPYLTGSTSTAEFLPAGILEPIMYGRRLEGAPMISAFEIPVFHNGPSEDQACRVLVLQQPSGEFGGLLRLTDREIPKGKLSLVAISKGTTSGRAFDRSFEWSIYSGKLWYYPSMYAIVYKERPLSASAAKVLKVDLAVAFGKEKVSNGLYNVNFECEFYNVLWVEHRDGVAYRKACGRIPKHIWEAHCSKRTIVLG